MDRATRLNKIIEELNSLTHEADNLEGYGATTLEMALDYRADMSAWGDDEPPELTPDEKAALIAECDRNAAKLNAIDERRLDLIDEYYEMTGTTPHYYELSGTYARSWHEQR